MPHNIIVKDIIFFFAPRPNIYLDVQPSTGHVEDLIWLTDAIANEGIHLKRVIIYTSTITACRHLYLWMHSTLQLKAYVDEDATRIFNSEKKMRFLLALV